MTTNRILFSLIAGALIATSSFARTMKDPARVSQLVSDYVLQEAKTAQQKFFNQQDAAKKQSQDEMYALMGKPVSADLKSGESVARQDMADRRFSDMQKTAAPDPAFTGYMQWAEKRRNANAVMAAQLDATLKAYDGKELDWASHTKLATQLDTLSNDRLAISIAEANAANEARARQKAQQAAIYKQELDEMKRNDAERRMARP